MTCSYKGDADLLFAYPPPFPFALKYEEQHWALAAASSVQHNMQLPTAGLGKCLGNFIWSSRVEQRWV